MFPLDVRGETYHEETRVMGPAYTLKNVCFKPRKNRVIAVQNIA